MPPKNLLKKPAKAPSKSKSKKNPEAGIKSSLRAGKTFDLLFENHPIPMWVYDAKSLISWQSTLRLWKLTDIHAPNFEK